LADGSQLPAVKGLLAAANSALARGDVELASVNLERAQRLAPQSATVYQKLAGTRLRQKRPAEAEQLARKALAYAGTPAQQAALWQLIANARQMQGQHAQAREAQARATALQTGAPGTAP
jgi:tetratricopeptide (TPR) repeat protein